MNKMSKIFLGAFFLTLLISFGVPLLFFRDDVQNMYPHFPWECLEGMSPCNPPGQRLPWDNSLVVFTGSLFFIFSVYSFFEKKKKK